MSYHPWWLRGSARSSRLAGALLAVAMLVVAWSAGMRYAAASSPAIQACAQKQQGNLRMVGSPDQCRPSEIPVSWDVQGVPGPSGPPGAPGVSGWERVEGPLIIVTNTTPGFFATGTSVATCSPGKRVLGGGYAYGGCSNPSIPSVVPQSYPDAAGTSWVAALMVPFGAPPCGFVAYAICANV